MKILLSPAKSIDTSKPFDVPMTSTAQFLPESEQLVAKLKKMSAKKLQTLMHVSADIAALNRARFEAWEAPVEAREEIIPAIMAFNGEAYRGFDARSLNHHQLNYAQQHVRLLSGLYGLLKPLDLLYPYRLEMGTKWELSAKQKNLYQFWGKKLSLALNAEMDRGGVLINLASTEYFKAIDLKTIKARIITPIFKEFKNGTYKVVMTYAKHARGAMARYIVVNELNDPEALKCYTVDGYTFDVKQSTETDWVFVR